MIISEQQKALLILAGFLLTEGTFVLFNFIYSGNKFWHFMGFGVSNSGSFSGWLLSAFVAAVFILQARRFPSVKFHMFYFSLLKVVAFFMSICAAILEEIMFRKYPMDFLLLHHWGNAVQILTSALMFGFIHGIWGFFSSKTAGFGAMLATGILGAALAMVYLASGRILAPCITAHFLIDLLIEPGLVLAALRKEMGKKTFPAATA